MGTPTREGRTGTHPLTYYIPMRSDSLAFWVVDGDKNGSRMPPKKPQTPAGKRNAKKGTLTKAPRTGECYCLWGVEGKGLGASEAASWYAIPPMSIDAINSCLSVARWPGGCSWGPEVMSGFPSAQLQPRKDVHRRERTTVLHGNRCRRMFSFGKHRLRRRPSLPGGGRGAWVGCPPHASRALFSHALRTRSSLHAGCTSLSNGTRRTALWTRLAWRPRR